MVLKRQTRPLSLVKPIQNQATGKNDERIEMFGVYLILFGPIVFFTAVVVDMALGINYFLNLGVIVGLIIIYKLITWTFTRLHPVALEEEGE